MDNKELKELRAKLDEIDDVLEAKFEERMHIVEQIGKVKKGQGKAVFNASREKEVLKRHTKKSSPALKPYTEKFFKALMDISKEYQEEL